MTSRTKFWKDTFNVIFPIYRIVYVDTEKFGIEHKRYLFMQVSKLQCSLPELNIIRIH